MIRHSTNNPRRRLASQCAGFTLVELVVVVLVLGIIAAVAAPKMFNTAKDARVASTKQSLSVVRDAIEQYRAQNSTYPGETGGPADFKNDIKTMIHSRFPKNQVPGALSDRKVKMETSGAPLSAGGTRDWKYDNVTGEFIINTAGYDTY
jgi:general secretion pathway protein G